MKGQIMSKNIFAIFFLIVLISSSIYSQRKETMKETPFACNMTAIEPSMRSKHIEKIKEVFQSTKEVKEISNGFAFLLSNESSVIINLVTFVDKERLCCPFFGFIIELEPEHGNVWLKVNGREGVKDFIKAEFGDYIPKNISFGK